MTFKKPIWKDLKFWAIAVPVLIVLGLIVPDPNKEAKAIAAKLEKDSLAIVNGEISYEIEDMSPYGLGDTRGLKTILVVSDSITEDQAVVLSKLLNAKNKDHVERNARGEYETFKRFLYMIKTYNTNNITDYNIVLDGPYDVIVERSHAHTLDVPKKVRGL